MRDKKIIVKNGNIYSLSIRAKNSLYNVCWYVDGVVKEKLAYNVSKAVALALKHNKETSTHKSGKIILMPQR